MDLSFSQVITHGLGMFTAPRDHEVGTELIKIKQTHQIIKMSNGCHKSRILHKDFEKNHSMIPSVGRMALGLP